MEASWDRNARNLEASRHPRAQSEWTFALVTVALMLLLQSNWDASLLWNAGGGSADTMASSVASGDLLRQVLGIALGLSGCYWLPRSSRSLRGWSSLGWIFLAWVGWLSVTVVFSDDILLSIKRFALLLMGLVSMAALSRLPIEKIFGAASFGVLANLIAGTTAEISLGTFHPGQPGYRFAGLTHPNMQGLLLAVGIFTAVGLAGVSHRLRWIGIGMALLFLCGLDLTGSRTAMIAFVLSTLFGCILLFFRRAGRRGRLMHIAVLAVCGLAFCTTVIVSFASVRSMLLAGVTKPRDEGNPEELTGRVPLWRVCETYASGHMLFGYGYGAFWSSKHIEDISAERGWPINEAHSAYIDMVLMSGVPGVSLFVVLLMGAATIVTRSFWKGENEGGIWAVIMVFALIHGLTEAIVLPFTFPSYVIFTGILGLAQGNRTSSPPLPR